MKYLYRIVLLLALSSLLQPGYGQQRPTPEVVSGTYRQVPFAEFIRQLETQTRYHFYFNPAETDSLAITAELSAQPLPQALELALRGTPLQFVLDEEEKRVYILGGPPLQATVPESFFQLATTEQTAQETPVVPTERGTGRVASVSAAELKRYEIGTAGSAAPGNKATVAGHIRTQTSGEPVIGATVYVEALKVGTTTDQYGYYSLTLPLGRHELRLRGIGIQNTRRQLVLHGNGKLDIETEEDIIPLKEVVIEAEKDKNVSGMQMGLEKLDIKTMRQVPTAFGETDILRVVLTLPGVKSVSEGNTGLNVRGGTADQNLILFNDAIIYNPSHLFGFFSAFNPDILQGVELYKSAIPAKYGGRLSSVLDITTREGNKKKFSGSGGVGPLTSRLTLEGPIVKDKSAFILSGRSSYSDWLLKLLPGKTFQESSASFYDLAAHVSHAFSDKNTLYLTAYRSADKFQLASDTAYRYNNQTASLKWRHSFSNKLYGVLTGTLSDYGYNITSQRDAATASRLAYGIRQYSGLADFSYFPNARHTVDFGVSSLRYNIEPGSQRPSGAESLVTPNVLPREQALESALYASDRFDITPRLSVSVGLRYSLYQALGPRAVYQYAPGKSRSTSSILDTVQYGAGKVLASYHGPEYRFSARYSLTDHSSVKLSYNRTRQYLHLLSNTVAVSPTDIWKLSDAYIRPQVGNQASMGYYHNLKSNTVETSVELYYKSTRDFVDYKGGATLLLNPHLETDVVNAMGRAYGVELLVRKLTGKLNGWVSYTYSRSLVKANAGPPADRVNGGRYYPSNFDKPHDLTLIGNYRFSRRVSTSLNLTYSTGRPITLPLATYYAGGAERVYYSERNAYRVPDYYRADVALNIEGNHKVRKLAHSSWTLGVYNLTGRDNPFSVYFKTVNGQIKGYKMAIFAHPIPAITYNFRF
ncbi:TonB-dependent receptor [Hymenobacter sp. DG25B]|uniref:TonB-dependent receptor n=1 Tax=Hymenobacter sp. DG25B TaxID=1385664 RepID=UPI000540E275|nr:TonB-dependent receptor [Hymenobacter sp. DG25B]AIZ62933.1 TonB-dependent receptor [Hymenobacter sp. DG25B]